MFPLRRRPVDDAVARDDLPSAERAQRRSRHDRIRLRPAGQADDCLGDIAMVQIRLCARRSARSDSPESECSACEDSPFAATRARVAGSRDRWSSSRGTESARVLCRSAASGSVTTVGHVPVELMQLLDWIAQRESDYPAASLNGNTLMQEASGMAGSDGMPWDAVAKTAARLRKRGYLDWDYDPWPNESQEPAPESIDQENFQRATNITITSPGVHALAAHRATGAATQLNIINSTVGQLALGNISNIDMFVILDGAERALEQIDAPAEVKEEARGVIRRMRDVGVSVISSTTREVLAAAVRQGLGLP